MQNKSKLKDKRQYERVYTEHDRSAAERKQISNLRKLVNVADRDRLRVQGSRVVFGHRMRIEKTMNTIVGSETRAIHDMHKVIIIEIIII